MSELSVVPTKEHLVSALSGTGVLPAGALIEYMRLLFEWNEKVNLTGAKTPEDLAIKHIADVWNAVQAYDPAPIIYDIGSGGGIPGIILAILRPDISVTLVERRQKKASAIASIVSQLGMDRRVKVISKSFEEIKGIPKDAEFWFRGFLPGPKLAVYLSEFFPHGDLGPIVLMKGPSWPQEKEDLMGQKKVKAKWLERFASAAEIPYELPHSAGQRLLVLV